MSVDEKRKTLDAGLCFFSCLGLSCLIPVVGEFPAKSLSYLFLDGP
jgi:hypothetical protein